MEEPKPRPFWSAGAVARIYMEKELKLLHGDSSIHHPETVVILHDACYGHRFSRPRPTKLSFNTIVERPERIQAVVLGVSTAYVRLGERHCDGKHPVDLHLDPTTLPNIPFRIQKTTRTLAINSPTVTNVHGTKWMDDLKYMCDATETKLADRMNEVLRPDDTEADIKAGNVLHKGDLYLCAESLNAFEGALGAVCDAVDAVFGNSPYKRAFVAVRPPGHHCSAQNPQGFCWVNNVHVGIMHGFLNHGLTHVAIIDFDLHHGDGSQAIAWEHNKRGNTSKNVAAWKKTSIGYFSLHDINSYPCEDGPDEKITNASVCIENAHGQNMWNVHLQEWKSEVEFWKLYQSKYSILLEKARTYLRTQTEKYRASGQVPKAAIFFSAGFDASQWENPNMQRHSVNVPTEFYARLSRDVVKLAAEEGLSVDGRIISVLEGGYSDRALYSGVLSHLTGLAGNAPLTPKEEVPGGSASTYEMSTRIGSLNRRNTLTDDGMKLRVPGFPYDPAWWSTAELDRLDATLAAPPPPEPPKKVPRLVPGNYSSPTHASCAKAVDPTKVRRTLSSVAAPPARAPTPPPAEVTWTDAAHELSKLLIPKDRPVSSHTYKELHAKTDRQSMLSQSDQGAEDGATNGHADPVLAAAPVRKSTREKKPVRPPGQAENDDSTRTRRKTVGGSTVATEKALARGIPVQHGSGPSRQYSGASTLPLDAPPVPMARPMTSQSFRPETTMGIRSQSSLSLHVKKTRPAVPARRESTRPAKKTQAATSKFENTNLPAQTELPINSAAESAPTATDAGSDVKDITNGMKKIKINVLTKEMKEARQQKAQAEKKAAEEKTRTPSLPVELMPGFPVPSEAERSKAAAAAAPKSAYPSLPPYPSSSAQPVPGAGQVDSTFVHYQPTGPSSIVSSPISSPIQFTEPITSAQAMLRQTQQIPTFNVSSVMSSPSRQGGHSFTPTSSIPFAPHEELQSPRKIEKANGGV